MAINRFSFGVSLFCFAPRLLGGTGMEGGVVRLGLNPSNPQFRGAAYILRV